MKQADRWDRHEAEEGAPFPEPGDAKSEASRGTQRSRRLALLAFVAAEVIALAVLLSLGRDRWFRYDEWEFLASRGLNLHDLFEAHAVHWSTLPIIYYRAMYKMFGLHYLPYQVGAVLTHLLVAALVRTVMRRAGVRPWTATAAASLLVFLGAGDENILWAFGITFAASLAFGLGQLILSDHDGSLTRRDWLALLAGFAGLLCSGVAVTMVIVVGIATLTRRGWRVAAFHTVPLGLAFGVWYFAIGDEGYRAAGSHGDVVGFTRTAVATAFDGMGQVPGFGWLLGALIVGGCFLAWRGRSILELRQFASAPAALLIGAFVFVLISGTGRGAELATATRYVHVFATLSLPAIAVAADAVMLRWRVTAPILAIALVASIVGNVRVLDTPGTRLADQFQQAYREQFLAMPRLPIAPRIPRGLHPDLGLAPWVSFGWMRDGIASGRFPRPGTMDPVALATSELKLALRQSYRHVVFRCQATATPAKARLEAGTSIRLAGPMTVVYTNAAGVRSDPVTFAPASGGIYLVAYAGPLELTVQTVPPNGAFELCDPSGGPFEVQGGP